jgi:hypothetical protein
MSEPQKPAPLLTVRAAVIFTISLATGGLVSAVAVLTGVGLVQVLLFGGSAFAGSALFWNKVIS